MTFRLSFVSVFSQLQILEKHLVSIRFLIRVIGLSVRQLEALTYKHTSNKHDQPTQVVSIPINCAPMTSTYTWTNISCVVTSTRRRWWNHYWWWETRGLLGRWRIVPFHTNWWWEYTRTVNICSWPILLCQLSGVPSRMVDGLNFWSQWGWMIWNKLLVGWIDVTRTSIDITRLIWMYTRYLHWIHFNNTTKCNITIHTHVYTHNMPSYHYMLMYCSTCHKSLRWAWSSLYSNVWQEKRLRLARVMTKTMMDLLTRVNML